MLDFLLNVVDNKVTGSGTPDNIHWDKYEINELTKGFIIGFFTAIAIILTIKLFVWGYKKLISYVSNTEKGDK